MASQRLVSWFSILMDMGLGPETDPQLSRYIRITNCAALVHVMLTFPYYWVFKALGATWLSHLVIPLTAFFAAIPFINRLGATTLSRHSLLAAINLCVYLYTASLGMETSIQNIFFFTLISPLMLFHTREWRSILLAVSEPVLLWALLVWKGSWIVPPSPFISHAYLIMSPAISATSALMIFACSFLLTFSYQRSTSRLEAARKLAEAHSREKSRFLATVSHEIRTPLNGIFGTVQSLRGSGLPESAKADLDLMQSSGELLLAIINDILDFSKIESGRLEIERMPFDPRSLLEECRRLILQPAEAKGLQVSLETAKEFPPLLVGDEVRCRQVLMNLLNNALKFTDRGSIRIRAASRQEADSSVRVEIEVEDTGIGIAPEAAPRLFHAFSQADASTTRRFGGTGLGLVIGKRLADAMGGDLAVRSVPGKGSVFTFTFLAGISRAEPSRAEVAAETAEVDYSGFRALLVEDNVTNQIIARKLLARLGFSVDLAVHGGEGVDMALSGGYDIVFMDVQMPVMDGIEATRAIRRAGMRATVLPVVAMTANASESDRQLCMEAGMDGFASKPIQLTMLRNAIRPLLAGAHRRNPPA